jgi:hypothetical protein
MTGEFTPLIFSVPLSCASASHFHSAVLFFFFPACGATMSAAGDGFAARPSRKPPFPEDAGEGPDLTWLEGLDGGRGGERASTASPSLCDLTGGPSRWLPSLRFGPRPWYSPRVVRAHLSILGRGNLGWGWRATRHG